ncbi:MAG: putative Ig domain-containing protein [Acidobacteria bacterium]|nr:putative Ig domain-containing protein [Acidobacteriota bacterium]
MRITPNPQRFLCFALLSFLVTGLGGCGSSGGGAPGGPPVSSPQNLSYSANPAIYTKGQAIPPNMPSSTGGPVAAYSIQPSPPAGLSFSPSSGILSGTPVVPAPTQAYLITAINAGGTATASLTFTVRDLPPTELSYTSNPATYTKGTPIPPNIPSNAGGAIVTYSVDPALPPGLFLDPTRGGITGTPSGVSPSAPFTVTGSNSGGSTSTTLQLTVVDQAPANLAYSTPSASYTRGVPIVPNLPSTTGGQPTSFSVQPALPGGLSLHASSGVITGTPTAVTGTSLFTVTASNSGGSCSTGIQIRIGEPAPQGLTYSANPAVYTRGMPISPNLPTSSGGAIASFSVSPPLPTGLALHPTTGVITGIPTAVFPQANYLVTGLGISGESVGAALSITVNDIPPSIGYGSGSFTFTVGVPVHLTPTNTGGTALAWSVSPALPLGLSLSPTSGLISGTPTDMAGTQERMVTATNSGGSGSVSLYLKVNPQPPAITQQPQDQLVYRGTKATFSVAATGTGPLSFQWRKNGADIPGATGTSYTTPATVLGDDNAFFSVAVSDSYGGSTPSTRALLRVQRAFTTSGTMVTPRTWGASVLLDNGQILILGGQTETELIAFAEIFNPATGQFRSTNPLPFPASTPTATLLPNGKVLVVSVPFIPSEPSALLWDPGSETFAPTGSLHAPRTHHSATLLANGKVLVAGGVSVPSGAMLGSAEIYDPTTGSWTLTGNLGGIRKDHAACLLPNGKVLIHGGNRNGPMIPEAEVYDPGTGTFAPTANVPGPRDCHALVPLPNGKVLVVGGSNSGWPVFVSQLYDPASNSFQTSGAMNLPRASLTSVHLGDGKVLAAGGFVGNSGDDPRCEVWDPATGNWTLGAPMVVPRFAHQGILLKDGRVLFAGGYFLPVSGPIVAKAEIYE